MRSHNVCLKSRGRVCAVTHAIRSTARGDRLRYFATCGQASFIHPGTRVPGDALSFTRNSFDDGSSRHAVQLLTRSTYSPVRVSTLMMLPILMKPGTMNSAPVSTLAGLVTLVAVSPLAPGAHSTTSSST